MAFPLLIFTDLDGTLLDHLTYSFEGAVETIARLHELSIPLILTSSKTRIEIQKLQLQLGLHEPFISENGGGIFLPPGYAVPDAAVFMQVDGYRGMVFGRPYSYIREVFAAVRDAYRIRGFGDMPVEEVMAHTGLSREDAVLAVQRDFTEPFLFAEKPRPEELQEELAPYGLKITRGGRFYHMMGEEQDKGRAVRETVRLFQVREETGMVTAALGDAPNDFAMLRAVDIPVLMPGPDGTCEAAEIPGLRMAPFPGSRGWGIIVAEIIDEVTQQ